MPYRDDPCDALFGGLSDHLSGGFIVDVRTNRVKRKRTHLYDAVVSGAHEVKYRRAAL